MFQQVTILGRVGKIEQKGTVTKINLVVNSKYKAKDGNLVETSEWFDCVAFGRTGEIASQYVQAGDMLFVIAEKSTNKVDDKYFTSFKIQELKMLPKGGDSSPKAPSKPSKGAVGKKAYTPAPQEDASDDLPF